MGRKAAVFADETFITRCSGCGASLEGFNPFCPDCGSMAEVDYNLEQVTLHDSENPYQRFRDLLPVKDASLLPVEARPTRTIHATRLGERFSLPNLYLKDETSHPTGTTKDRMVTVALPYLFETGVRSFTLSSTGNSSTAFGNAIGRFPEMVMYLFTGADFADRLHLPRSDQIVSFLLRDATFVETYNEAKRYAGEHGLTPERGFFNPSRREGLKLAFLEAVEQVPEPIDWYFQAVSSAMGLYGASQGARQLRELGLIDRLPRLVCVQEATCAPMVTAWEAGADRIRPQDIVPRPRGIAMAILRGDPTATYRQVRERVMESGGTFVAVNENEIRDAQRWVEEDEGVTPCFAAAAALAGAIRLRLTGAMSPDETVLVNLTGSKRPMAPSVGNARYMRPTPQGWVVEDQRGDQASGSTS